MDEDDLRNFINMYTTILPVDSYDRSRVYTRYPLWYDTYKENLIEEDGEYDA